MNEMRNTLESLTIPRTGTLAITHVVDLAALVERHGDPIPVHEIMDGGHYEVSIEKGGRSRKIWTTGTEDTARAFLQGAKAIADLRRAANKKASKKPGGAS